MEPYDAPATSPTTTATPLPAPSAPAGSRGRALVTGVTGYVGGLLVQPLLEAGWTVRVLTRDARRLAGRPWADRVEITQGDATDPDALAEATRDVDVAYYLLHAMDGAGDFARRDRDMAEGFAAACDDAGVRRLVYLSGLHPEGELSPHLASRVEVGDIFLRGRVPAAVLQAAVVLGDGSASFDMLRHLTQRLPAMVAPSWLDNRIQPIAVTDVLHYLVHAADLPADLNRTFDIGGPEVLTYRQMIARFAQVTGLRPRVVVTVPVLTPRLAGYWVGLVTPVSAGVAKPLVGSLVHEVVRREEDLDALVPPPPGGLTGFDDAVRAAMRGARPSTGPRNLALAGAATVACAVIGGVATKPDSAWYRSLDLPPWQPPALAFPVVWTGLYASIAGASASVLTTYDDAERAADSGRYRRALAANLVLNAGWSWVFWRARRPWAAAATAAVLAGSSVDLARRAGQAGPVHRRVLTPYAAWCSFAALLSAEIARRNPRFDR